MRVRVVALVVIGGVAGCGGDGNGAATAREVRATAREFVRSIHVRDYERVCRMVTREVRADWAAFARRNPKQFSTGGCPAFAADFYRRPRRTLRGDIARIERASVRVEGGHATITAHPRDMRRGRDVTTVLRKVEGRWLLGD